MQNGLDLLHTQAQEALRKITKIYDLSAGEPRSGVDPRGTERTDAVDDEHMSNPPACELCGESPIAPFAEAFVSLRGQWMFNKQAHAVILVLDPNIKLQVVALENGQLGLVFADGQQASTAISHVHAKCLEQVLQWAPDMFQDDDFDEDL